MSKDARRALLKLIGDKYVITSRYYECEKVITCQEFVDAIDALIRQRISEALGRSADEVTGGT